MVQGRSTRSLGLPALLVALVSLGACTGDPAPSPTAAGTEAAAQCPVDAEELSEVLGWEFGPVEPTVVDGARASGSDEGFVYVECSALVAEEGHDDEPGTEDAESDADAGGEREEAHVVVVANYAYYVEPFETGSEDCHGVETADGEWTPAEVEVAGLTDLLGATQDITDQSAEYAAFRGLTGCLETAPDLAVITRQVVGDPADLVSEDDLATLLGMVVERLPRDRDALRELGATAD
ncbi:hypothetical protein [Salsipaludibacter albus]|uniref:hypothetical protein n=1 Tax=Salsipaludibacter albus TaxID=2849650 RepID=UPI001EE3B1D4|nr:hypothetical protein [Salsipaludibacter albus]MBY5161404.1 hypothetical protein [Salsipaludibacter albus]